jgi:probable aminopeptidase NPEPL1
LTVPLAGSTFARMAHTFQYTDLASAIDSAELLVLVGRSERLLADDVRALLPEGVAWDRMLDATKAGDAGASAGTWTSVEQPARVVACVLPEPNSRYNSPARPHAISALVRKAVGTEKSAAIVVAVDEVAHGLAAGVAVARAFSLFDGKSAKDEDEEPLAIRVAVLPPEGEADLVRIGHIGDAIRLAGRLVDVPTSVLDVPAFVQEARTVAEDVGASIKVISSAELRDGGFGGLWGVGKAATEGPALVVLSHEPEGAERTLAFVGKGIVYDTGGLSIKGKDNMPGMKADMGGAATVLGAFQAAVKVGAKDTVHALLCLAENAVGPESTRPDDILSMYSGKQVEINNTDAEGRLVLADGVSYASKHLAPDVIVDLATLTGAALLATGRKHSAIITDDDELEAKAVAAGRATGDLVHPLPYVPEFYRAEFRSEVADMKNSVKDRMNAQTSCAAQFVGEHLDDDWEGSWLHVDMAGPVQADDRGTGYGVALLLELFELGL